MGRLIKKLENDSKHYQFLREAGKNKSDLVKCSITFWVYHGIKFYAKNNSRKNKETKENI